MSRRINTQVSARVRRGKTRVEVEVTLERHHIPQKVKDLIPDYYYYYY